MHWRMSTASPGVARPSIGRGLRRSLAHLLDGVGVAEVVVASLLAAVLLLPRFVDERAWTPALAVVAVLTLYTVVRRRRLPPVPLVLVLYLLVYVLALVHGRTVHVSDLKEGYFVRPMTALAVATVVVTPLQRLRALVLILVVVLVQAPVTAVQTIENTVSYGRQAVASGAVDNVVGLAGYGEVGVAALAGVGAAAIVAAAWLAGALRTALAVFLGAALVAVGALTSTRVTAVLVVAAGGAIVIGAAAAWWPHPPLRRLTAVGVSSVVAAGGIIGLTLSLYAGAYHGALFGVQTEQVSSPETRVIDGKQVAVTAGCGSDIAVLGNPCLPGRLYGIKLAVRLSTRDGLGVAVLGRGLGSAYVSDEATDIPPPKKTGFTWFGKILTETGWLGVSAFLLLLGWLLLIGVRLVRSNAEATADRILGIALPGVVGLTAAGAGYTTILTTRGYATVFWVLVGVAISAYADIAPEGWGRWRRWTRRAADSGTAPAAS
jgi:hypothetical protein